MDFDAKKAREVASKSYDDAIERELDSLLSQIQVFIKKAATGFQRSAVFKVKSSVSPAVLRWGENELEEAGYDVTIKRRFFGGWLFIIRW